MESEKKMKRTALLDKELAVEEPRVPQMMKVGHNQRARFSDTMTRRTKAANKVNGVVFCIDCSPPHIIFINPF